MKVGQTIVQSLITALMGVIGQGDTFPRMVDEIRRVNERLPDSTGAEKKAQVLADLEIIFDDLIVPIATRTVNLLIEVALVYLASQASADK
jgi:hypothetical protein